MFSLFIERIEELKMLMSECRALYLKEKRELEEINMGKHDDRLNDIMAKVEKLVINFFMFSDLNWLRM